MKKQVLFILSLFVIITIATPLAGCGRTGSLYLPHPPSHNQVNAK